MASEVVVIAIPKSPRKVLSSRISEPRRKGKSSHSSPRRKLGNEIIGGGHRGGKAGQAERVHDEEGGDVPRRRNGEIRETTLQAAAFLQDQRALAGGQVDYPAEPHRIHGAAVVEPYHGGKTISIEVSGVIEQPEIAAIGGVAVEMPLHPARDVVGRGVEPARAFGAERRLRIRHWCAVEIVPLHRA